jgi:hypothetical protein
LNVILRMNMYKLSIVSGLLDVLASFTSWTSSSCPRIKVSRFTRDKFQAFTPPKTLGRVLFLCQKMDMIHFLRGNPTILAQHLKFL